MRRVVMVCSGNTCRSPMAEVMLRDMLPEIDVISAGTLTVDGLPASEGSLREMARRGLSLILHRSRKLREADAKGALVLCMENMHLRMVRDMYPDAQADTLLHFAGMAGGVPDPYGGTAAEYRATADLIEEALRRIVDGKLLDK